MGQPVRFIVVAGPPCSGKSFVARRIANQFHAAHLEMDRFRERLLPLSDQRVEDRDLAYRAMHWTAELMAPFCSSIVMDATYTAQTCRTDLMEVIERVHGSVFVIECHTGVEQAIERFLRRDPHPARDLTPSRVARLAAAYPYFADAFGIGAGEAGGDEVSHAIQYVHGEPLDASNLRLWTLRGRPRERTQDRLSAAALE
jgi:predicted kinase